MDTSQKTKATNFQFANLKLSETGGKKKKACDTRTLGFELDFSDRDFGLFKF